ncbi:MAG TPA: TolC family outer membrane protein [Burkholderiaceae bacterium]|nr:TolC family outer membrane protein [Burkholderiaceae bacterium]HMY98009.1 TolC family outer membrane protein [Burkholderiaceae bacterium]HNB42836.1 TolC family outer membrane protein [Burkholderiaceae bacterium]HNG78734.1 TolC family outer membrane protein [Burkholderiaceae bacterium]
MQVWSLIQAARLRDPALSAAVASADAAQERAVQSRAALWPSLNAVVGRSSTRTVDLDSTSPSSAERVAFSTRQGVQLSVPLIRASTWSAIDQADAGLAAAQLQREVARLDADQRLVTALIGLIVAQEQFELTQAQAVATAEQVAAARRKFQVGTVSVTDVKEAEAKFDSVTAQQDAARFEQQSHREELADLVGMSAQQLPSSVGRLGELDVATDSLALTEWLDRADQDHPGVQQARLQLTGAQLEVEKARRTHWPTLDATASRTHNRGDAPSLFSPGNTRVTQAEVTLNVPLFAGGATESKVREAVALEGKARADLEVTRQKVLATVRQAYFALQAARSQARGQRTAEESARIALKANRRAYEVGLRVNADVLSAQSQWFEARRDLVRARHEVWLQRIKLAAAAGALGGTELGWLDAQLEPAERVPAELKP